MDVFFENRGAPGLRALVEVNYQPRHMKQTYIWIVVYLLLGAFYLYRHLNGESYLVVPLFFFAWAVYVALTPYLRMRKNEKKKQAFYNGRQPDEIVRFGERIEYEYENGSQNWEYFHLTQVCSLKYSYCLHFTDQSAIMLGRETFTKGTFDEFKQFLRKKRPDLKIPD